MNCIILIEFELLVFEIDTISRDKRGLYCVGYLLCNNFKSFSMSKVCLIRHSPGRTFVFFIKGFGSFSGFIALSFASFDLVASSESL